ncbi:GIY-YIG nuclease family protein [Marinifilum sp. D714]|uniref:GIY-YIG nuclease family protein n=1 Tax=Marinifilum sp. D714 TaxID=2937523 RepID=UPI0027D00FDA|nr:GIY-YIG nuclease family protein [Marinifilum sp. D714]MDQ2179569.1 GIY-YIG nuclease family protein [Marinifilum sp. D714]
MFHIYILYSVSSDKYYIGYTENTSKRLYMHNNPIDSKYTSKHLPWELKKSFEVGNNKTIALKMERKIKNMKSRKFIEKLLIPNEGKKIFKDLLLKITPDC